MLLDSDTKLELMMFGLTVYSGECQCIADSSLTLNQLPSRTAGADTV